MYVIGNCYTYYLTRLSPENTYPISTPLCEKGYPGHRGVFTDPQKRFPWLSDECQITIYQSQFGAHMLDVTYSGYLILLSSSCGSSGNKFQIQITESQNTALVLSKNSESHFSAAQMVVWSCGCAGRLGAPHGPLPSSRENSVFICLGNYFAYRRFEASHHISCLVVRWWP